MFFEFVKKVWKLMSWNMVYMKDEDLFLMHWWNRDICAQNASQFQEGLSNLFKHEAIQPKIETSLFKGEDMALEFLYDIIYMGQEKESDQERILGCLNGELFT